MKRIFKMLTVSALICLLCFSAVYSVQKFGTDKKASVVAEQTFVSSGMTLSGGVYYTPNANSEATLTYNGGDVSSYDTANMTFKFTTSIANTADSYIAFLFRRSSSEYYIVKYFPNTYGTSAVQVNHVTQSGGAWYSVCRSSNLDGQTYFADNWITLTATLSDGVVRVCVNGNEVVTSTDCTISSWSLIQVNIYGVETYVKNVYLSSSNSGWFGDWEITRGNWTKSGDVLTSEKVNGVVSMITFKDTDLTKYNCVEADVRYDVLSSTGEGGINIEIFDGSFNGAHVFNLASNNPDNPVARLYNQEETDYNHIFREYVASKGVSLGTWVHIKAVVDKFYYAFYINDYLVYGDSYYLPNTLMWDKVNIYSWDCPCSIKNVSVKFEELDYSVVAPNVIDMEFHSKNSIYNFGVRNGTIGYENGKLTATVDGSNNLLIIDSPHFDNVARGTKYKMYLPVHNTFLVRMSNTTSATQVRVWVRDNVNDTGDWADRTFDINNNGKDTTYYFNMSNLLTSMSRTLNSYMLQFQFGFVNPGTSGTVKIDAISCEREDALYDWAGSVTSCTASASTRMVTVNGTVKSNYNGKTVTIYRSDIGNYTESLSYSSSAYTGTGLVALTTCKASNGKFTATFPLYKGDTMNTELSSLFLAVVDGVKISHHFKIENYRDFSVAGERFKVNIKKTVNVKDSPYNAKGDGFTDDTAAIQAAIDAVEQAGGGKVIIPGDTSNQYGNRYVISHLELCSNLEFIIEEGATLWQSSRDWELNKTVPVMQRGYNKVRFGHDCDVDGLVWCHTFAVVNIPLICVRNRENVRVTGGGNIRLCDQGSEELDPTKHVGTTAYAYHCAYTVHQMPICFYSNNHIDYTDITVLRSNGWQMYNSFNNDGYIANITEKEQGDETSDGITITSCKNYLVERCMWYTSDDAIGLCTSYEDKRGQFYRPTKPGLDNSLENIRVFHTFAFGGWGVVYMPYGTAAPNAHNAEIRGIEIGDCVLGGHKSTGSWSDDPFHGYSKLYTFSNSEPHDIGAVKDVYYHDNVYLKQWDLSLGSLVLNITNLVITDTDIPLYSQESKNLPTSPSEILNGTFDKLIYNRTNTEVDETKYVVGLIYWSERPGSNGAVGTEKVGTKTAQIIGTSNTFTQDNYAAFIKGNGELFQGVFEVAGSYDFSVLIKAVSGTTTLFARDAISGKILAQKQITNASSFATQTLRFKTVAATVQIGVMHSGTASQIVYFDNAVINQVADASIYTVEGGNTYSNDFSANKNGFTSFSPNGVQPSVSGGYLVTDANDEYKIIYTALSNLTEYEISIDLVGSGNINAGVYINATDIIQDIDGLYGFNVQVEGTYSKYSLTVYKFFGRFAGVKKTVTNITGNGSRVSLRVVVKGNTVFVYSNGATTSQLTTYLEYTSGQVGMRSFYSATKFDNFSLKLQGVQNDKAQLNALITTVKGLNSALYTTASYSALTTALSTTESVGDYEAQSVVDSAYSSLLTAYNNLVLRGDKTQLNALLTTAKSKVQASYTTASYNALQTAIQNAEGLGVDATQSQVDTAYNNLSNAINNLVLRGDKTQLNSLLTTAKSKVQASYTTASYNALQTAIQNAEGLGVDATQVQVDTAYNNLNTAINNLVLRGDKTQLNSLLTTAKSKVQASYTTASYNALQTAIQNAEGLGVDATQGEVDQAYGVLSEAYNGLETLPDSESESSQVESSEISQEDLSVSEQSVSEESENVSSESEQSVSEEITSDSEISESQESQSYEEEVSSISATDSSASSRQRVGGGCGANIGAMPLVAVLGMVVLVLIKRFVKE